MAARRVNFLQGHGHWLVAHVDGCTPMSLGVALIGPSWLFKKKARREHKIGRNYTRGGRGPGKNWNLGIASR